MNEFNIKVPNCPKLIADVNKKVKYKIYYLNLRHAISLGYVLTHIHDIVAFRSTNWLASYIDQNTLKRNQSTNQTMSSYYKLKVGKIETRGSNYVKLGFFFFCLSHLVLSPTHPSFQNNSVFGKVS